MAKAFLRNLVLAAGAATLVVACGGKQDPATLIASGKAFADKGEHAAAVIQFKNAIQAAPNSAEARFLLAKSLAETGNLPGALVEFRKARDAGYAREASDRQIARVLLQMGDGATILKEAGDFRAESAEGRAELRAIVGEAHIGAGDMKKAEAAFAEALQAQPGHPQATTGQARLTAMRGDLPGARKMLDDLLQRAPETQAALGLRADIAKAQGQLPQAVADLEQLIKLNPRHMGARFTLAITQFERGARPAAEAQLEEMRKLSPGDPRVAFVTAMVAYGKGQIDAAAEAVQIALKDMPNFVPALVLGGMVALQRSELVQAEANLGRALEQQPLHLGARRAMAMVHLRNGRVKQAQDVLAPMLQRMPQDPELLSTQAEIFLAQGNGERALQIFEQLAGRDSRQVDARIRVGEIRAREGKADLALAEFDKALAANPNAYRALVAKVAVQMSRGAFDGALKVIGELEEKQPKNPLTFDLKGQALLGKKDVDGARANFERAVSLQPNYYAAHNRLAAMDIAAGKHDAARKRFEDLAKADTKSATPLLALAQVGTTTGVPAAEVTDILNRAVKADAASAQARVALITWLMRTNDFKRAVIVAQEAVTAFPQNRGFAQMLASAQLGAGDTQQAIAGLQKLAADATQVDVEALALLARAHNQARNPSAAASALRKAVDARPDAFNLRRELALAYVAANDVQRGLEEAKRLKALKGGAAGGAVLEGDVHAAQKKWNEAAAAYRQALAVDRSGLIVTRLHSVLNAAGRKDEAASTIEAWRRESPKDEMVPMYLAEQALAARDYQTAAGLLRPLVERSPSNPVYLNNLAFAMAKLGDAKSVEVAERAWKVDPYNAAILDTFGWALTRFGDAKRGLPMLESAARLAPAMGEIRLHFAEALIKANRKDDARRELGEAVKSADVTVRNAAEALLKSL